MSIYSRIFVTLPFRTVMSKTQSRKSASLKCARDASVGLHPNYQASSSGYGTPAAALPPWTLCNWSAAFQWTHALALSFAIDNVFNKMPPADHTYPGSTSQPYNPNNYNVYGRSYLPALRFEPRI